MVTVIRYSDKYKEIWNKFVATSKNRLFMFNRDYMDYHSDRFMDHSLLFYDDNKLIAILPMNEKEHMFFSHGGLTYGGFITDISMKQHTMNDCFTELIYYAKKNQISEIVYKTVPHIYHFQPAEEDRYALFANGASIANVDVSTYLNLSNPIKMLKGRHAQISRAKREGVIVEEKQELKDFESFIELENEVLYKRHNTKAVHTGAELKMLHDRFPNNIHLIVAKKNDEMIAGTVIYEYPEVIHTQYMASNDCGRYVGGLDLVISYVIDKYRNCKKWLDFGISTEHDRVYLNEGLVAQKEGFGGRTGVYEIWRMKLVN